MFAASYKADAVSTLQIMRKLAYSPPALLAYGAGYEDPGYVAATEAGRPECGLPAPNPYGVITRVAWSPDVEGQRAIARKVAALFKRRYGTEMTSKSARGFTAMLALAQAIDDPGSTDPAKIQAALRQLDVTASQTIMPWAGIRFDRYGQNTRAQVVLEQKTPRGDIVVYPKAFAKGQAIWPHKRAQR